MKIKIVTDSGSDLPRDVADELGITIVPLHVHFGAVSYKDGVDLQPEEFFKKLVTDSTHPTTSSPAPGDFAEVYEKLSQGCDGIISVHLSSKVSATYEAALKGKDIVAPGKCPIEVIDSRLITSPLALLAKGAAKAAASGSNMQETLDHIQRLIPAIRAYGILDTLKYIIKGGRLGRAGAAVGSLLPVRPVLTIKDGGVSMVGVARTRSKAIERLVDLFRPVRNVEEVAIAHSAADEEILSFVGKLREFLPDIEPMIGKLGPAIGTHGGPGTILVAMQQKLGQIDADLEAEEKRPGQLPSMHSLRESIRHRMQRDASPFCTGLLISA